MNINSKLIFFFIIIVIAFLTVNCKKKSNDNELVTSITYPAENSSFSAIDTILVKFTVKDNKLVTSTYITIIDENNIPVSPPLTKTINQQTAEIEISYIINNIHLSSGTYYLEVNANDNSGYSKSFLKIYINEIPQKIIKTYLFSKYSGNTTKVYTIDSLNNINYLFFFNDILQNAVSNSYFQQLSLLGKNYGKLETYNTSSNSLSWEVDNINNVLFPFNGILRQLDNFVYSCFGTGYIKGFDNYGNIIKTANIGDNNYSALDFIKFNNRVVASIKPYDTQSPKISVMDYASGTFLNNYSIKFDIVEMFNYDNEKILIWGNKNDTVHVFTFDILYNILNEIPNFPTNKLSSVIETDDNYFIAAIGNDLFSFYNIYNSPLIFKQNVTAQKLRYEHLSNSIYAIDGMNISIFHYPDALNTGNIQHNDSIADIEFLYNK